MSRIPNRRRFMCLDYIVSVMVVITYNHWPLRFRGISATTGPRKKVAMERTHFQNGTKTTHKLINQALFGGSLMYTPEVNQSWRQLWKYGCDKDYLREWVRALRQHLRLIVGFGTHTAPAAEYIYTLIFCMYSLSVRDGLQGHWTQIDLSWLCSHDALHSVSASP